MSRQQSFKQGVASNSKKEDSARDLVRESFPKGSPVGGAFGSRVSPIGGEDDLLPDDKQHRGTHTTYEPNEKS
jgi:hypothetical protein